MSLPDRSEPEHPRLRRWVARTRRMAALESPETMMVGADSGDGWITHAPSVRAQDAVRSTIRLPFRVLAGLGALFASFGAMVMDGEVPLIARVCMLLFGIVFGAFALVPDGDLGRMLPRISSGPRLPAPGDMDAE